MNQSDQVEVGAPAAQAVAAWRRIYKEETKRKDIQSEETDLVLQGVKVWENGKHVSKAAPCVK